MSTRFTRLAAPFIARHDLKSDRVRRIFDIEADGLLDQATKVHCIVIANLDDHQIDAYGPDQIPEALDALASDCLVGHNITGYDLPLLRRLYDWAPGPECTILDTLIISRLILPDVSDLDDKTVATGGSALGKLHGRYSLEAWGARLGMAKSGADIDDFSIWTPKLQERCAADVLICMALWRFLSPDGYSEPAVALEHRVAAICNQITADGVPFDVAAAEQRRQQWTKRRAALDMQLSQQFPGTNLNSRPQIGALLEARGWVPDKRTEKTKQAKIDDELLESIPALYPEFTGLAERFTLDRRLGQLADGKKGWLKHVGEDGRLHGAIVHIGTPHSRAAHFDPNLAQVPNPKRGKPLANECRALFHHPGDWVFVACDQAGLQDRCFSHYLAAFDGGAYGRSFVAGVDTHWNSAIALSLIPSGTARDKANKLHIALREGSKSFRYGFLFGMGAKRAGQIITTIIRAAQQIDPSYRGPSPDGAQALKRFEAATPGLKQLRISLKAQATRNGWVTGLDGRRVPTGAQYKALNRIVTSAEAIVCKRWLIKVYDELHARFRYGWDDDVVITAWVHDELVCCCRPEIADQVGEIMVRQARDPGKFYDLKVPLDAEYKIGRTWAGDDALHVHQGQAPDGTEQLNGAKVADAVLAGHPGSRASKITNPRAFVAVEPKAGHHTPVENDANPNNSATTSTDEYLNRNRSKCIDKILCPFHDDHDPSLEIYDDGHYHCYVCKAHGNADELPEPVPAASEDLPKRQVDTLKSGLRLWQRSKSIIGTLAERYLVETRKLDLAIVANIDDVLRFHPKCPFDGKTYPCLIALFRDVETNEPAGIHRIALTAKAEKIGRMMLGSWPTPRAIKLRSAGENLLVGEGIETAIAGEMKLGWQSGLWAMGDAGAIGKLPVIDGVNKLGVLVDREASGTGENAARQCAERWRYAGRHVALLRPRQAGADFNDIVKEKGT